MKLSQIHSAGDLKQCTETELLEIAREIREAIIHRTSIRGGHVGPSLGATDIILALHYVFNCPDDKIIFDISHQSYAHKILTNRLQGFTQEINSAPSQVTVIHVKVTVICFTWGTHPPPSVWRAGS